MRWLVAIVAVSAAACSGGTKCPEPQYEGVASDEAYLSLIDGEARATADAMKGPVFTLTDGMELSADPPPTFRWSSTLALSKPGAPGPRKPSPWWRGLFISEAYAHLPPVTGVTYWLKFAVPGEKCPIELMTTRTEYTPNADLWAKLKGGTGARSITGIAAYLTENRITEGPFKMPAPVTFTVK
ncbi:MAG: hypothetical protein JNK82_22910 [Myxococcaceae bacterium]|nr:hypothetical protein [Myxococcaceae bacterium]